MSNTKDSNSNLIPVDAIQPAKLELDAVRQKLSEASGPKFWRTLDELSDRSEFGELLEREFPRQASEWVDPVSRRGFLKLAGASMALAGLAGCTRQPLEQILPYVRQPEELIPGKPVFYATAMPFAGHAVPLLVETHEFRPTKIEGNPQHPASLGSTDIFAQASILNLYDPDRSTSVTFMGEPSTWANFVGELRKEVGAPGVVSRQKAVRGAGLRFLCCSTSSPTFAAQMKALQQQLPQAKWHWYEPVHRDGVRAGSKLALGGYYDAVYKFDAADVVVSLDADFLSGAWFPGFVRYARDFMSRRKLDGKEMNRFYVAESSPSTTGAKADHRLPARAADIDKIARALAAKLGVTGVGSVQLTQEQQSWVDAAAADLMQHRGKGLVVPGVFQSAVVNALAHAINAVLGNTGQTVSYIDPVEVAAVEHGQSIRELVDDVNAGRVDALVMIGGNPVYDAPVDLEFEKALGKVKVAIQLSLYRNETTDHVHWHIPAAHYLESWSDARAYDGTVTIIQPMIRPLYDGKSAHELLAVFGDNPGASDYELIRNYWKTQRTGADFDMWWKRTVHDGQIAGSASPARQITARLAALPAPENAGAEDIEIVFRPDPTIYDGSFINNGWLQTTPKPLTHNTWDNVAMISPAMAQRMKLDQVNDQADHQSDAQNILEVEFQGRKVEVPYWAQPGHPDYAVTLFMGYGQTRTGRTGRDTDANTSRGYNAYSVRPGAAQYSGGAGKVVRTDKYWSLAVTQGHFSMDGREPVKVSTLEKYSRNHNFAHEHREEEPHDQSDSRPESLYPKYSEQAWYKDYSWGMAIDLNSCIGCQTCVVACHAENNIPVIPKDQIQRGREMQWLRVDTYYEGDPANPSAYFQPVPCMQCENAPCEPVCPVGATVHSTEGLNDMVYNRCVGTRYCSNNCPYKVRRFNFLLFSDFDTPSLKMMRNPDVTVRSRGVMEKCTYCVQRISEARIAAEKEDRSIRDGDVVTACQQACPTEAIIFGNINDPNSRVSKLKASERNYALLAELNTRPRTTYIAAVENPNPAFKSPAPAEKA